MNEAGTFPYPIVQFALDKSGRHLEFLINCGAAPFKKNVLSLRSRSGGVPSGSPNLYTISEQYL